MKLDELFPGSEAAKNGVPVQIQNKVVPVEVTKIAPNAAVSLSITYDNAFLKQAEKVNWPQSNAARLGLPVWVQGSETSITVAPRLPSAFVPGKMVTVRKIFPQVTAAGLIDPKKDVGQSFKVLDVAGQWAKLDGWGWLNVGVLAGLCWTGEDD